MLPEGSITQWIHRLHGDGPEAIEALWGRYFPKLVQLAREKLQGKPCRMADEEDVALSAMVRFFQATQENRYPGLSDREELWRLLSQIVVHRVIDLRRYENRQRRTGTHVPIDVGQLAGRAIGGDFADADASNAVSSPEFDLLMAEQCRQLLEELPDAEMRAIVLAKMDGATNAEIATVLNCSGRTIERRLKRIRNKWKDVLNSG
jgi:RNA polymerase sigma factor (sigma-70 family)